MARIEHKTRIKASLEDAFDYVVEPVNRPEWIGSVLEVKDISPGPIGVGTTWNERQKVAGKMLEYRCTMTEVERPHRWAMEMIMLGTKSNLVNTFEAENGTILMTLIIDYTLPGSFLGQIADRLLFERIFDKTCRENAGTLKMVLESKQDTD
jgi:uncharacterized protein YndB with AHSA1/START domain